jgi:hypothetical protein
MKKPREYTKEEVLAIRAKRVKAVQQWRAENPEEYLKRNKIACKKWYQKSKDYFKKRREEEQEQFKKALGKNTK